MKIILIQSKYLVLICLLILFLPSCSKKSLQKPLPPQQNIPVVGTATFKQGGYTLIFTNTNPDFDTSIRTKMVNIFFIVYPKEAARFNPSSTKTVTFIIDTSYDGVAATGDGKTTFSAAYYHSTPNDIDVVTHEVMHIVQGYPQYDPVWLVEGIADYARFTYGVDNTGAGWTLPPYSSDQKYTDSYRVTARFLVWIQEHLTDKIVDELDKALRANTYTNNTWKTITGKTVDDLWSDYGKNPTLKEDAPPIGNATDVTTGATVTVSQENSGGGSAPEGSLKVIDNDIYTKIFTADFKSDLWIQVKLSSAKSANAYILTSGNDNPDRDPKNWEIAGSNDAKNWTELDSRTNENFDTRNLTKKYTFDNTNAYQYYKLTVSQNNGSVDFQLSEWRMLHQ